MSALTWRAMPEPRKPRNGGRRTPSMADVAAHAGVSHQTVSRVLNDSPLVKEDTRDRVLAAIEELGYRRNSAARMLATNRSGRIGMISAHLALHGPEHDRGRGAGGRRTRPATTCPWSGSPDLSAGDAARGGRPAARPGGRGDRGRGRPPRRARARPLPRPADPGRPRPGRHRRASRWRPASTRRRGARLATEHLLDLGHARRRPRDRAAGLGRGRAAPRRLAARPRARAACCPARELDRRLVGPAAATTPGCGSPTTPTSPPSSPPTTRWRSGVLQRAARAAVAPVPGDVSVVGFDDVPEAAFYWPALTTVTPGVLGRSAGSAVDARPCGPWPGRTAGHRLVAARPWSSAPRRRAPRRPATARC